MINFAITPAKQGVGELELNLRTDFLNINYLITSMYRENGRQTWSDKEQYKIYPDLYRYCKLSI